MIRRNRIIFILLLSFIVGGCFDKHSKEQKLSKTVITGNVKNLDVYPNTKEFIATILDFRDKKTTFRDSIKSDGSFKIEFGLYKTQDIEVYPIVGKIIAAPGDSIHLEIDFNDIGNVQFFGDNQKSNRDLNKYLNSNYCVFNFGERETRRMNLSSYKSFCDSVKTIAEKKRQDFIEEIKPTPQIIDWTKDYININYQKSLLNYPFYIAYQNKIGYHDLELPNNYYNFLENIEKNFSETIINTAIYELLDVYTGSFAQKAIKDTTLTTGDYFRELMNALIDKHEQSYFKQFLIGNIFYLNLNKNDLDFYTDNKLLLEKNIHETFISVPLNSYYNNLQKHLDNPEVNSKAILSKLDGTSGKFLIDSILSQMQGKVLYVDFWATWCGPCKAEMPNSKKLKQKMAGKDIEFVYICLDSNEKQWNLTLSEMQLDGNHYLCDKEQTRDIRKAFDINGIPHYMLINKNGHIVEAGSYLRPLNPVTIEKIDELLTDKY